MFNHSEKLKKSLLFALNDKGKAYQARTRYLDQNKRPLYINRLILEDSPYLLQHAHNPVDWYPWGNEAFNRAREENKAVFLSIGYSTCHWCHVMEEESFDNEAIAKQMNDSFICIKVDRELHSDVDTFYMTAVMMMQGHGGWPMSSFLTPDKKPFFGGTYYQPSQFTALMSRVNEAWHQQADEILKQADAISQQVADAMASRQSLNEIGTNVIELSAQAVMNHHDARFGGFGQAPKFPNEPYLYFLLEYAIYSGNEEVLNAVVSTLHIQSCGGIYDQVAGGFHRYATDKNWLIPHFEKMLYNQANLSCVFTQAYSLTGAKDFKRTACETLDYVMREMTNDAGAFYSATDADSEGEEGLFFIWDKQEVESLLSHNEAKEFIELYQLTKSGNFESKNILNLNAPLETYATKNNINYDELIERLNKSKKILWDAREKRTPPLRDDKIITAWNGMMIKAFAYAGQQLKHQNYIDAAIKAADYILKKNKTENNELSRSSLEGQASIPALQEDYAYLAEALLQIYDATQDKAWLNQATTLTNKMIENFWDEDNGGFFMGARTEESLLPTSPKEINDNATASGNSVAMRTLVRLARRSDAVHYQNYAHQLIQAYADDISQRPYICSYLICGLLEMHIGEQSNRQWCATGNIYIDSEVGLDNNVILNISINDGWHLNQVQNDENAVPITIESLSDWHISNINYPEPITKTLGFQAEPVSVHEGKLRISFGISNDKTDDAAFSNKILKLKLGLQACDEKKCLAPESVNLVLFL